MASDATAARKSRVPVYRDVDWRTGGQVHRSTPQRGCREVAEKLDLAHPLCVGPGERAVASGFVSVVHRHDAKRRERRQP
jgi:hypothetical protein